MITPSPQLDFLQVSKERTFVECHRKYYWRFIRNLDANRISIPFYVGGLYHDGLEMFYQKKPLKEILNTIEAKIDKFEQEQFIRPDEIGRLESSRAIVLGMISGYCKHYKKDLKDWKIIATEVFCEATLPGFTTPFIGTIDLVYEHKGMIKIG